jgi:hypothetical protein
MKRAPYTLAEAEKICAEYQYLVGESYATGGDLKIECITTTPFDEVSKERFLILYFLLNNAEGAKANEYNGLLFDVLIIGRSATDQHELQQEDICSWLMKNKNLNPVASA